MLHPHAVRTILVILGPLWSIQNGGRAERAELRVIARREHNVAVGGAEHLVRHDRGVGGAPARGFGIGD